jgi:hypothetical protein
MVTGKLPTSIRKAVVDFGPKILNEAKLTNILLDYGAFTEVPSAKIVIKELVAESWCAKILEAQDDDNKIQSLISVISDKMGFKTDVVEYTVHSVVYSISKNKSLPQYNKAEEQTTSIPISSPITSQKLDGEYSEKLRTGGDLKVTANSWKISYYFPGPDGRYNGTFVYVNDKDIDVVLGLLPEGAVYYFAQPSTSRALPCNELLARWQNLHPNHQDCMCFSSVKDAVAAVKQKATEEDIIFIGGSNYVVGEAISLYAR